MKRLIIIFAACFLVCGCSKVRHIDQLLTLKDLADEQERLNKYVDQQDRNFDLMLEEARAGTLEHYTDKTAIREKFGEPVYARNIITDDREMESWLYRYATAYFGAEKIYLYFDSDGILVKSEYREGTHGESEQETAPEDGHQEI